MKHSYKWAPVGIAALILTACATPKSLSYLLDMEYGRDYPAPPAPELVIQPDDCLGIQVSSDTPEMAAPFNLPGKAAEAYRYPVDRNGDIEFPILGKLHVAGLTLAQIKESIAERIRKGGYIREPIVLVTLDNFTVTVIGRIDNHVLPVTEGSINLFQVIARSGEVSAQSNIRDVMVVRTEGGVRRSYTVNLQSKDIFDSPVFYLRQQDIVYVKPRGGGLTTNGQTVLTFVGSGLTLVSIISNFILWSTRR